MGTVVQVLLWALFAIVVLIVLLLVCPVSVFLRYQAEQLSVKVQVLFVRVQVYPMRKKSKKKKKAEPKEETPKKEKSKKKRKKKGVSLGNIAAVLSSAGSAMRKIFKALYITKVDVVYPIYKEDAAQTAIAYGNMQAYVGSALGFLQNITNIQLENVRIFADFQNEFAKERNFSCKIGARPIIIVIIGIYLFCRLKEEKVL